MMTIDARLASIAALSIVTTLVIIDVVMDAAAGGAPAHLAMEAFAALCRTEGIIPAIETAHALAGAMRLGRELGPEAVIVVNLSGRGDKDVETAARWFGIDLSGTQAP